MEKYTYNDYYCDEKNISTIKLDVVKHGPFSVYLVYDKGYMIDDYRIKFSLYSTEGINDIKNIDKNILGYYFYINISKKYILIIIYRELFELFASNEKNDDKYIIMDINGNIIYFKNSNKENENEINLKNLETLKKIKLIFTREKYDTAYKFNILCGIYKKLCNITDIYDINEINNKIDEVDNIKYLLYLWAFKFIKNEEYYNFVFIDISNNLRYKNNYIISCNFDTYLKTFFQNIIPNSEIYKNVETYYKTLSIMIGGFKKYKIIKNI